MPPKRRRRFQGLYYHSSPPKVLPMNGQLPNDSARRRRGSDDFSIKLSTIRIWMHEKEIGKLTRILWAGQGNRLRQQASTNPRVKRFLAAVPYVMNSIRDVHQAVIDNNLENLQAHLEPPVPPALVTCRDANGLNLIHKAAGLGHATILEYLITTWPDGVHECDITGKTPLHWAASAKNNMRCYTLLTQAGCDEEAVDYKMKTPSFYRHKPHEIERAFLTYVPEAPRVSPDVATDWEALSDDSGDGKNPNIKIPEMNGFGRHSNTESNENTSEAEMTEGASAADDDDAGGGDDEALTEEPEKEGEPAAEENGDGDAEPVADEEEEEEQAEEEKPAEDETEDKKVEENGEETESANEETQTNDDEAAAAAEDKEEPQDEKQTQSVNETNATTTTNDSETNKAEEEDHEGENEKQNDEEESENSKETVIEKSDEGAQEREDNEKEVNEKDEKTIETAEEIKEIEEKKVGTEDSDKSEKKKEDDEDLESHDKEKEEDEVVESHDKAKEEKEDLESHDKGKEEEEDLESHDKGKEEKEDLESHDKGKAEEKSEDHVKENEQDSSKEAETKEGENEANDKANEVELNGNNKGEHNEEKGDSIKEGDNEGKGDGKDVVKDMEDKDDLTKNDHEKDSLEEGNQENNKNNEKDEENETVEKTNKNNEKEDDNKDKENDDQTQGKNGDSKTEGKHEESSIKDETEISVDSGKVDANITKNKEDSAKEDVNSTKEETITEVETEKEKKNETNGKPAENEKMPDVGSNKSSENGKDEEQVPKTDDNQKDIKIIEEKSENAEEEIKKEKLGTNESFVKLNLVPTGILKADHKETSMSDEKKKTEEQEEDENNNNAVSPTNNEEKDDHDPNRSSESPQKSPKSPSDTDESQDIEDFLKQTQQDISDKFDEISDNLKENVKEFSNKIKNIFTTSDENENDDKRDGDEREDNKTPKDSNENESNDIVVGNANTPKSQHKVVNGKGSGRKSGKHRSGGENSSEDDDDEDDEETEAEAAADDGENDNDDEKENDEEGEEDEENEPNDEEDNENDVENDVDNNETDKDNENEAEKDDDNEEENAEAEPEDDGGADGTESPTSSMAIEGFVEGVADDNTVQSHKAAYVEDDNDEESRINRIIASGDMEQLAQIVLNGDGQKLLNVKAKESEIQAFLRNVPNYMDKIRRVHEAARGGSLLNLQQALDRRKFAIAKDEISPNGATPLHVAVLFGHSDIVRYLSARFPETTSVTDNDGRTALHYAAVISDNGHFYNVLQQLGANPKAMDNFDKTPEQYLADNDMKDTFNYGLLLKNFGAEELEEQLLSDQGKIENHSFEENPIFKTEQGKYLAENLADPLIKALTQVAQKRPQDPLQYLTNYLQTFVAQRNTNGRTVVQAAVHSGSSHTDSTALAANSQTDSLEEKPVIPTSRMNGHVTRDKGEDIGTDPAQQQIDDEDADEAEAALSKRLEERDEHGQSMLHFASARSHRRGGLLQLIEESNVDITYRDELYRTARDVALQANQVVNAKDIDRYLISLAIVGDVKPFEYFAIAGYDHIIDVMEDDRSIIEVAESKGHTELATYLRTIRPMEELREELHQMIRDHKVDRVKEIVAGPEAKWLLMARNYYGRTALHIAILKEDEELVEHFVKICPEALKIGDNLERSPLHYAMGTNLVEGISRILIQNGAKRTNKDLKGRQPSYYFMNKADILRLQEEEDENR
ncbi:biorientation of chromosomes in cell division protein 1-like 1 isoform X1 [Musca domestica]|uniref:Biorientation of chromosomes in cell division protein 1-like 1 isoform X1 n=2 Tax=Musca domestica TaxID=7370 RepID=A0ABM3V7F5_MUSDO|nr:biorientation of chromosomes in cell division protein 1-like 1 isoform X1 [Musca domestica]XP_058981721.1 biorientation of chromosomes in cell division protein 1-like 1 isoform X1 [Musca domestica]XP_058981722.1 biorientation of chromosomes in cell division protein 1-like 1 isoform X1 [Musca domestica]XP_058981723.1 biorientation of chromosomes in cell division protein 1-like 1 isoform X1 [Musca domestica]